MKHFESETSASGSSRGKSHLSSAPSDEMANINLHSLPCAVGAIRFVQEHNDTNGPKAVDLQKVLM